MFLLERSNFGSENYNRAERAILSGQRYGNDTAMPKLACDLSAASELVTRVLQIVDADRSHVVNGSPRNRGTIQRKRQCPLKLAEPSNVSQVLVFDDKDIDVLSLTNLCRLFSYRLQNGRNIARRVRDQAQNLAHRRQFAGEPRGFCFLTGGR